MRSESIAALDVGGTHVTAGMVTLGDSAVSNVVEVRPLNSAGTAVEILDTITHSLRRLDLRNGVGIALPGPFDYDKGIAWYQGVSKFEALHGRDLRSALATSLDVRPASIRFIKDADAYAIGEWLVGSGRQTERMMLLTLGTGVGSSFLIKGAPYVGSDVPPLGDVYTLKQDGKPLEDYVSRRAIRRSFRVAGGDDFDVKVIADLARRGEPIASKVFADAMQWLARIVGPVMRNFQPDLVVLGGSIAQSSDLLIPSFAEALSREGAGACHVDVATHFEEAPLIGAASSIARLRAAGRPE